MENHVQQQRVGGCNDQRVPAGTLDSQPFFSSDSEGPYFALRVCWMIILLGCASAGPTQTSGTHNLNGPRPQSLFDFYPKWTLCGDKNKKKSADSSFNALKRKHAVWWNWTKTLWIVYNRFDFYLHTLWGGTRPRPSWADNREWVCARKFSVSMSSIAGWKKRTWGKMFWLQFKKTKKNTVCSYDRSSDSVRQDIHPNTGKLQLYELL